MDMNKHKINAFLKSKLCYGVNRPGAHEGEYEKEREFRSFPIAHGHQGIRAGHVCYKHGGESAAAADTTVQEIQVSHPRNIRGP